MKRFIGILVILALVVSVFPVTVFAGPNTNLAKGKEVWASDRYSDGYMPKNVNDGSTSTDWASGSIIMNDRSGPYCYIAIDLGMRYNITQIIARSRRDSNDGYTRTGWQVQVSNDRNFQEYVEVGKKMDPGPFKDDFILNFDTDPQSYRYVRVAHETRARMVISEIEVYGEPYMGEPRTEYSDTEGLLRNSSNILKYLGIMDGTDKRTFSPDLLLTRAEAVEVVLNAVNNRDTLETTLPYNDVSGDISGRIGMALSLDIVSPAEEFKPFDYVTVTEITKMILYASGYGELVKAKGGYPSGVVNVANSLGWKPYIGQGWSEVASRETIANLIYAALTSPVYETVLISGDYIKNGKGESLLERAFGLELYSGVVTANSVTGLNEYEKNGDEYVEIDYRKYIDNTGCVSDYIGKRVIYFINPDMPSRIEEGFLCGEQNSIVTVASENIKSYSDKKLTYTDANGKDETVVLKDDVSFIKNGVAKADTSLSELKSMNATIEIISTDTDKAAECIYLNIPVIIVTDYCADNGKTLKLKGSNNVNIETEYDKISFYKNGREVMAEQIYMDTLTYCYISDNEKVIRIESSTETVEGIVESITDNSAIIDGKEYEFTEYFKEYGGKSQLSVSQEVILLPDSDGRIVWLFEGDSHVGEKYAVLLGTEKTQAMSSGSVRMFTEDNEFVICNISSKLRINGNPAGYTELAPYKGQLIIISINPSGELARVYTEGNSLRRLEKTESPSSNSFYYKNAVYDGRLEGNHMLFPVDLNAIVFTLPYTDGTLAVSEEYEKYYMTGTFSGSVSSGSFLGSLVFYNTDDFGTPSLLIKKTERSASEAAMINTTSPENYLVERVAKAALNGEDYLSLSVINLRSGEKVRMYYAMQNNKIFRYDDMLRKGSMFTNDSERYIFRNLTDYGMQHLNEYEMNASDLKQGDIIRGQVSSNNKSEFEAIDRIYTSDAFVKDVAYVSYGDYGPTVRSQYIIRCGKLGNISNGFFGMTVDGDNLYTFDYSGSNILICHDGKVEIINPDQLLNYLDDDSDVVVYTSYGNDYAIVIYN